MTFKLGTWLLRAIKVGKEECPMILQYSASWIAAIRIAIIDQLFEKLLKNFNYSKVYQRYICIFCKSGFVEYDYEIYDAILFFADFLLLFTLISELKTI